MSSISLSACERNDYKSVFEKFVKEVQDLYVDIDSDASLSFDAVEMRVSDGNLRSLEQKFLEMCVSKKTGKKESEVVECPVCKAPCRPLRRREKHLTTLCGDQISIRRWVYSCGQGHRHSPWDNKQ